MLSCKERNSEMELATEFYKVLNNDDYSNISLLFSDSIISKELDYKMIFSKQDYIEFLKWDSTFKPEYKVLEIREENEIIKARILQKDIRILFLHEEPIITNQVIRFNNGKISNIEIVEYVRFNESLFNSNRSKFLSWLDKNHPDLNGFIHNQTKKGGLKYLNAIQLYQEANK